MSTQLDYTEAEVANALWTHDGYAVNQAITKYAECISAWDPEANRLRDGWTWQTVSDWMAADILRSA